MAIPWLIISIAVLIVVLLAVFITRKKMKNKKLSPLASLALMFILVGILFGDRRIVGYSLMGIGVVFAIIDIVLKSKKK